MTERALIVSEHSGNLEQYCGPWAIYAPALDALVDRFAVMDQARHAQLAALAAARESRSGYTVSGSTAIIEMIGAMTKNGSSMSGYRGSVAIQQAVNDAVADESVGQILLLIDSPGGSVAGTVDLADAVAAANKRKPVTAYIQDMGASAAYWVASQASRVVANRNAMVGSIGVYTVLQDTSMADAADGIRTIVVKTGKHKAIGVPGTPITEEHVSEIQRNIDALNDMFVAAVATGRRISVEQARGVADGRVHVGQEARAIGLIDAVDTFENTLLTMESANTGRKKAETTKGTRMSEDTRPTATYEELKACLPGVTAEFICAQLEKKATLDQAQTAWMEHQQAEIARVKSAAAAPGVQPVATVKGSKSADTEAEFDDPRGQFDAEVRKLVAHGISRGNAVRRVAAEQPALHKEYLKAANSPSARDAIELSR